jgi:predicted nucleic acid-binding protein
MRLALDTNRYTDLCRGAVEVVELVEHAEAVFLPFIVLGELRAGFSLGTRGVESERVLRSFLL